MDVTAAEPQFSPGDCGAAEDNEWLYEPRSLDELFATLSALPAQDRRRALAALCRGEARLAYRELTLRSGEAWFWTPASELSVTQLTASGEVQLCI
jgi:hypothetical protein